MQLLTALPFSYPAAYCDLASHFHGGTTIPAAVRSREVPERMADRLIVALDVRSPAEAEELVQRLDGVVSFFKILD